MSESLVRRTPARVINRFLVWWVVFSLTAAAVLFATGQDAAALGAIVSPILVGALARRLKRSMQLRNVNAMGGFVIAAAVSAMPGVVMILVGYLIGGAIIVFVGTAIGTTIIAVYALLGTLANSLKEP